jgi:hypothetical protein
MIPRIRGPKKLGRSGESRVPQPWSIIAEPVKVGGEWYVLARHPSGQYVHVRRFNTQSEAKFWIARKSKAWLGSQNGARRIISAGVADESRGPPPSEWLSGHRGGSTGPRKVISPPPAQAMTMAAPAGLNVAARESTDKL